MTKYENTEKYFLDEEEANKFCEETAQLSRGLQKAEMLLAPRLYKIRKQKLYQKAYQYEKLYMFCDEINMSESKVSRLSSIYEKFVITLGVPFDALQNIDYTKLDVIKKVCETKDLAYHWIDEAKELSIRDLKRKVKAVIGEDDPECDHQNTYLVRHCKDCSEHWEELGDQTLTISKKSLLQAILEAKELIKGDKDTLRGVEFLEKELKYNLTLE